MRVEPTGGITATDVQKALEGVDAATLKNLTLVVPSELTIAGSPTSGNAPTVTVGKGNVAANLIAAGPASGAAAAWSFRPMVAADIPAGIVTYAKIQNEGASTLIGNPTGAPAAPSEITLGATLAFSGTSLRTAALTGDVTSGANSFATTVTKINGTTLGSTTATAGNLLVGSGAQWASVAVSGDAALSSAGLLTIAAGAISYAKIQNVAALRLIGNSTGAPAAPSEITLGAALTFAGSALQTLAHTGDVTTPANSLVTTVAAIAGTAVSGTTGTTNVVFSGSPTITTPSIARINGGSAAGSTLELRATTGVGIGAEAVTFTGGTNGGVTLGGFYSNVGVQGRLGVGTVPTCSAEISGSGSDPLLDQYRATVSAHATNGGGSVGMAFANLGVASVGTAAVIQFGLNNITPSFRSGAALVASTQDTAVATFSADFAIQTYAAGTFATRAYV
ncbi:MAG TPA: hypothetical protein VKJ07_08395, partial [Mycobacteriales bacterium]|nr:hypothetical protein [Mycobacteriales bacterium]